MASLNSKNGSYRITFGLHGKRMTIYTGKMELREAERLRDKVKELARIKDRNGRIEDSEDIFKWVSKIIGTKLHDKLVNIGLVKAIKDTQLESFIDAYIASRTDIKVTTRTKHVFSKKLIVKHLGADTDIRHITFAHVSEFKAALMTKYASATVGLTLVRGKQFFAHAVDAGIINRNPFDKLKMPSQKNPSRLFFVDRETSQKVLDACPNLQWRLIFSLARFGGLRIPSELIGLQWSDVLWAEKKMRVSSPKTEHHEGKDHRWVPLFPEILEPLERAWEEAKEGDQFIFPRKFTKESNIRKRLTGIIKKAGLSPWPKVFQNLRASRETELCKDFPLHVAAKWIGNSPTVAIGHYLTVLDSDHERATSTTEKSTTNGTTSGAEMTHFTTYSGGSKTGQDVPSLIENGLNSSVLSTISEELIKKAQPLERAELFSGKSKSTSVYLMIFEISPVIFSISASLRAPLNA